MKKVLCKIFALTLLVGAAQAVPMGTVFTYHGRLVDNGGPANGEYDFRFLLFDDPVAGNSLANYIVLPATVSNGLFSVELDFGPGAFDGSARWLDVGVKPHSALINYTTLTPRQAVLAAPYALYARNAGGVLSNSITSDMLVPGAVNSSALADVVDLGQTNINGQLLVYRTAANTAAIGLYGANSSILTYGSDGLEQTKLGGADYGELLLHNSLSNNAKSVILSAGLPTGGKLYLNNAAGYTRAEIEGHNNGGSLRLFQVDGDSGIYMTGDNAGAGFIGVAATNGSSAVYLNGLFGGTIYSGNSIRAASRLQSDNMVEAVGTLKLVNVLGGPTWAAIERNGAGGGAFRTYDTSGNTTAMLGSYGNGAGGAFLNLHMINSVWPGVALAGDDGDSGAIYVKAANDATRIKLDAHNGVSSQMTMYHTDGTKTVDLVAGENSTSGSRLLMYQKNGTRTIEVDSEVNANGGGYIGINGPTGTPAIQLWAKYTDNKARIVTPVIQITGGADLSEQFDVATEENSAEPGMVMCIDPQNPGKLRVSHQAYDRTVAGVISGAGGVEPGLMMGHQGTVANGQHPVALTGRVYVHTDADIAPIEPGDLLTTAETPGHAMKVTDPSKAQGAILGKAMTALTKGKGLVLVLVTLQ